MTRSRSARTARQARAGHSRASRRRRGSSSGSLAGNLRVAVMCQMECDVELPVQQRRARGQPANNGIGPAGGEGGLVHRLVRGREQRHLHDAEHQNRGQQHPGPGNGDQPTAPKQQPSVNAEAHGSVGICPARKCAQRRWVENPICYQGHEQNCMQSVSHQSGGGQASRGRPSKTATGRSVRPPCRIALSGNCARLANARPSSAGTRPE